MNSIEKRLNALLSKMSLDEKLAQIGSYWIYELQTAGELDSGKLQARLGHGIGQISRVGGGSNMPPVKAAKVGNQIQKFLVEQTRLGIPAILHEESCSGAMFLGGTAFPQMIGLASTFQPELAEKMTQVIRRQLMAIGARQALAPVLDVARDPRWGRTEETFGEDPTLISHFGVAYIRGMQGSDLAQGVLATGKHFIGHSLSQGGLNCGPIHLGMRELYDVLLPPFQAAIRDAGMATIMNSYPELDGEVIAASRAILTDLLRNELGFTGLVVSDYDAVIMLHNFHRVAENKALAGSLALKAGIDVELPTVVCYGDALKDALASGDLDLETIDTAVRRHLQKKFELGLFETPYVDEGHVLEVFETSQQRDLACEIACQSMVLLKNDGLLPLRKNIDTLAVIGPLADDGRSLLGDYSYAATVELLQHQSQDGSALMGSGKESIQIVTPLAGIRKLVSKNTKVLFAQGCQYMVPDTTQLNDAVQIAKLSDAVVLFLGDRSGLTPGCTTGETRDSVDLRLPGTQNQLAQAILATGKPVVVVLVSGRPYAIPELAQNANAILDAWLPGEEGGTAIAKTIFGDNNPAGKLPISFPRHVGQVPIYYSHKPSGMKSHWYGEYVSEKTTPLFPFGHGLSYTSFEYSRLSLSTPQARPGETVAISLQVTNTGKLPGDEVVQLYIRDEYASSPRPMKELKGYARIRLAPGASQTVTFNLPVNQLAFINTEKQLVLEPGRIFFMLGSSSNDIRLNSEFEIIGSATLPLKERVFVCPVQLD